MCSEIDSRFSTLPNLFLNIEHEQTSKLNILTFGGKVAYIYNPLEYAHETHKDYVLKYCNGPKRLLFLGMNPGPFGMAQNGVPFGEVQLVKNWLKIEGNVHKPQIEHPQRVVQGLNCKRSEVSGQRLWSLFKEVSTTPESFFQNCFVHNYCPLAFLTSSGKNITPPELPAGYRKQMINICDEALSKVISLLEVEFIVGVGKFAEQRAKDVVNLYEISDVKVYGIMHPSPVNPAANKGWKETVTRQLMEFGLFDLLKS